MQKKRAELVRGGLVIHVGDCLPWLEGFAEKSVDVAIFDPPYSEHVHKNSLRAGNKERKRDKSKASISSRRELAFESITPEMMRRVSEHAARIVRRWCLVFCPAEMIGDWRFMLRGSGLEHVRVGVWHKPNAAPQFTGDRPAANHEHVMIAHGTNDGRPVKKRWGGGGHGCVWTHNVEQHHRLHTTEKPLSLMVELVDLFSERGELVIDPFAGSGSTGAACIRRGRRFLGAELDAEVAELAATRLAAEVEGSTYEARRAGQGALFAEGAIA